MAPGVGTLRAAFGERLQRMLVDPTYAHSAGLGLSVLLDSRCSDLAIKIYAKSFRHAAEGSPNDAAAPTGQAELRPGPAVGMTGRSTQSDGIQRYPQPPPNGVPDARQLGQARAGNARDLAG